MSKIDIVKGKAALQLSIIPVTLNDRGYVDKDGGVFLQFASILPNKSPSGHNLYDWQNKITFSLGMNDIFTIVGFYDSLMFGYLDRDIQNSIKLVHVPPGQDETQVKRLEVRNGTAQYAGTFTLNMRSPAGQSIVVPMSMGEMSIFINLCKEASIAISGLSHSLQRVQSKKG
jgi:hypothetical protein